MKLTLVGHPEPNPEEEDVWHGSNRLRLQKDGELVWTNGSATVFRRFASTVRNSLRKRSVFAVFDSVLCACTLAHDLVQVNGENGSSWDISLPFIGRRIWANPLGGFYVERWRSSKDDDPLAPVLFTVSHPLDEPRPVDLDQTESVVGMLQDEPYILTFDTDAKKHRLWKAERVTQSQTSASNNIESEVKLELIRVLPIAERCKRIFLVHSVTKEPLLCILSETNQRLYQLKLDASQNSDFTIEQCRDATSIRNSIQPGMRDAVVLTRDGKLELYRGNIRLCQLASGFQASIIGLQSCPSIDENFDVVLDNKMRVRFAARLYRSRMSEAVNAILEAADLTDPVFGLALRMDLICNGQVEDDMQSLVNLVSEFVTSTVGSKIQSMAPPKSAFERLLASEYHAAKSGHALFGRTESAQKQIIAPQGSVPFQATLVCRIVGNRLLAVLLAFLNNAHRSYESLKTSVLSSPGALKMACFLGGLMRGLLGVESSVFHGYDDYYRRDFASDYVPFNFGIPVNRIAELESRIEMPPPNALISLFHCLASGEDEEEKWAKGPIRDLMRIFKYIHRSDDIEALKAMLEAGLDARKIESLPVGLQIVIREVLHRCRELPPSGLSRSAYELMGREDVFASMSGPRGIDENIGKSASAGGDDFMSSMQSLTKLRFGKDRRVREVVRLLDSTTPPLLVVKRKPEMTEHDLIIAQQAKLKRLICKALAGALGRGAITLFTKKNLEEKTVTAPALAKSGRVPPQQVEIQLDEANAVNASWPSFHNGVAACLARIQRQGPISIATRDLLRSWILFNKPKPLTDTHAGIVLALGLNRDLACLTVPDTYEYLGPRHGLTSIATLLGLGCAKAGSCDFNVRRTLTLHVPSLYPQEISDADFVATLVPAAALAGLGMLYRGTCNRLMCEFFLEEIAKSPTSNSSVDERETYSLCAGLALGLAALGFGAIEGGLAGLSDLELEDKLQLLVVGGPLEKLSQEAADFDDADKAWGSGGGGSRSRSKSGVSGIDRTRGSQAEREPRCARVLEGTHVNTDVTAPGAAMALGLIYLKSNEASVAQRLAPPATRYMLENVRPDLLVYRVWARALIRWDSVQPTMEWIQEQIPSYLLNMKSSSDAQDSKFFAQARAYLVAGAALGIGCCYAGTANKSARDSLLDLFKAACRPTSSSSQTDAPPPFPVHLLVQTDSTCADVCLSSIIIALGMVMAGTGDLATLKTMRAFRNGARRYGAQQMASLALGFLFLGAGKLSFSRSKEAIAALVCSVFPILAKTPEDNSAYLQALRHLYVLASEPRSVEAFDADTNQPCFAPLVVTLKQPLVADESSFACPPDLADLVSRSNNDQEMSESTMTGDAARSIRVVAPCILPPLEFIASIKVESPRYWPLVFAPEKLPLKLVVKLRADQLPYQMDPRGLSSLSARPRPRSRNELVGSLRDFSSKSPFVLAFAKHVPDHFEIVYECLVRNCLDALPCLLEVATFTRDSATPLQAQQVRFIKQYYGLNLSRKRLLWDRLLLVDAKLSPSALGAYVKRESSLVDLSRKGAFEVSLNLAGIPRLAELGQMDLLNPAGISRASKLMEPDAVLELCDALFG